MKRIVAILMTISIFLIMGTGCFGCNGCFGCGAKANPRVAVVLPESMGDDLLREAEETMKSMSGQHRIEYIFEKFSTQDEQSSIIDTLVGWRANAIVMWPVDASSAESAVNMINEAKIPLILCNNRIANVTPTVYADMGSTMEASGEKAAAYYNTFFSESLEKGDAVSYISVMSGDSNGFIDAFEANLNPSITMKESLSIDGTRDGAKSVMSSWLSSSEKTVRESIYAVFTDSDEAALGVMDAIKEYKAGKQSIKLITGFGGDGLQLENHTLAKVTCATFTSGTDTLSAAIQCAAAIVTGEKEFDGRNIEGSFEMGSVTIAYKK